MKSTFRRLHAAALAALLALATPAITSGEEVDASGNLNPNLLNCCTCITLNAGEPALGTDGSYTVTISWEISEEEPCGQVSISGAELTRGPGQISAGDTDNSIKVTITADEAREHEGSWRLRVTCEPDPVESTTETEGASTPESGCEIEFKLPGCDSDCYATGCDQTGEADMQNPGDTANGDSSVTINIPTTQSNGGITSGNLRLISADFGDFGSAGSFTFPGRAGLVANVPADFTVTTDDGLITQIDTGATLLKVVDGPGSNAFTVTHQFPGDPVIRTTTVSYIEQDGILRMDTSLTGDPVTRHQQTRPAAGTFIIERGRVTTAGDFQPLQRETVVQPPHSAGLRVRTRTVEERPHPDAGWHIVSVIETTEEHQIRGWVKTKEVIDPDRPMHTGAKLTSTWSYYQPGSPAESLGRLMHHSRYDGYQSLHTYALHQSTVITPYAGNPAGKTTTTEWDPVAKIRTVTVQADGGILSQTITQHTATSTTRTVETGAAPLVTTTHYKPSGSEFGGKPVRTLHPDGTLTTYDYDFTASGGMETITESGSTEDDTTVSEGIRTITITNSRGTVILRETQAIGFGDADEETYDLMAVTDVDSLGRALVTAWFPESAAATGELATADNPAWTTSVTYSCCGIAMQTDKYGIPTFHAYDHLQRRIKTNRLGVTTETHYLGLTTETHRYPESVTVELDATLADNSDNLIAKTTRNLAGTASSSFSPDPTSTDPGDLVETITLTEYAPAPGLSRRTLTTTPDTFTQTTDYFLDGRTATTSGQLAPGMEYTYTVNETGEISTRSYLDGGTPRETTITQTDRAGRTLQTAKGTIVIDYHYFDNNADVGSRGKLEKTIDADSVTTLFAYNDRGERTTTAIKLDSEDIPTPGTDQITFTETVPAMRNGTTPVWRTINEVWDINDAVPPATVKTIVSENDRTPDGLQSWTYQIGRGTTHTVIDLNTPATPKDWTVTTTHPDETYNLTTYLGGLMDVSANYSSNDVLISSIAMHDSTGDPISGYDTLNRPTHRTDSRTAAAGPTQTTYLSATADFIASVEDPGERKTTFIYDSRGRRTHVDAPETPNPAGGDHDNITETIYNPDGTVHEVKGDQTYRVEYGYDYALRMKTMTTFGTETATTTWIYNENTGLLDRKQYQGGDGTSYQYTPGGRLSKRTWQRGVITEYHYDSGGRQRAIDYSDGTPDVLFTLDALGRIVTEAQGTLAFNGDDPVMANPDRTINHTHDPDTLLTESETHDLGDLTRTLVRTYDDFARPEIVAAGIATANPAVLQSTEHSIEYHYGTDGRLLGIDAKDLPQLDQKDYGIEYAYAPNSAHLVHTLTRAGSGSAADLVTTHTWDPTRDVLFVKDNRLDGAAIPVSQYDYSNHVNDLGQRQKVVTAGTAFGETDRGWTWGYDNLGQVTVAANTADSELDRDYLFDGIGNRLESTVGDTSPVTTEYDPTPLNQYSSITIGAGNPLAPVHDPDGNLTEDATFNKDHKDDEDREYVWDGENRLIAVNKVTARDNEGEITGSDPLITYAYDSRSRRIRRTDVAAGVVTWYLYDGWNVVAEYTDNGEDPLALSRTYTWGTDLSGTLQGAGGVGGLLAVRVHGDDHPGNYYPTFDGNGNVSEYLTDDGVRKAHYEYDPFGNDVTPGTAKGDLHGFFSYRFSTKPFDDISGWFYYGYRYYDPVTGRWPSRDPIGERGGLNLYGFVADNPIDKIDKLGNEPHMRRGVPHEKPELPKYSADCSCCDAEKILEGRKSLEAQYNSMHGKFQNAERPHFGEGDDSCYAVNSEIALDLRVPKCWRCYLERRLRFSHHVYLMKPAYKDHWVIVCRAIEDRGGVCEETGEEAIFDYWANRPAGEDPDLWFREAYPIYDNEDDNIDFRHRQCGGGKDVFF